MKKLQIAVGIIRNENNEIFITRRAADAHMANKLEFSGGKIEMGETPEQAVGNDSNLLIVFYVQIMPDDFVMQLHRF